MSHKVSHLILLTILLSACQNIMPSDKGYLYGTAKVIDGDTLRVAGADIRLFGIDAPEVSQTCTRRGVEWLCGEAAKKRMIKLAEGKVVRCNTRGRDSRYRRPVAVCWLGGKELNRMMAAEGMAVIDERYPTDYQKEQAAARKAKRGVWAGEFEQPKDWRQQNH